MSLTCTLVRKLKAGGSVRTQLTITDPAVLARIQAKGMANAQATLGTIGEELLERAGAFSLEDAQCRIALGIPGVYLVGVETLAKE